MNKQIDIFALIKLLEIPTSKIDFLKTLFNKGTYQGAVYGLQELKKSAKKQRRILSKKYHPDLASGNAELMKEINAAVDILLQLKIEPPRPQPMVIVFQFGGGFATTATAATNTATTMF